MSGVYQPETLDPSRRWQACRVGYLPRRVISLNRQQFALQPRVPLPSAKITPDCRWPKGSAAMRETIVESTELLEDVDKATLWRGKSCSVHGPAACSAAQPPARPVSRAIFFGSGGDSASSDSQHAPAVDAAPPPPLSRQPQILESCLAVASDGTIFAASLDGAVLVFAADLSWTSVPVASHRSVGERIQCISLVEFSVLPGSPSQRLLFVVTCRGLVSVLHHSSAGSFRDRLDCVLSFPCASSSLSCCSFLRNAYDTVQFASTSAPPFQPPPWASPQRGSRVASVASPTLPSTPAGGLVSAVDSSISLLQVKSPAKLPSASIGFVIATIDRMLQLFHVDVTHSAEEDRIVVCYGRMVHFVQHTTSVRSMVLLCSPAAAPAPMAREGADHAVATGCPGEVRIACGLMNGGCCILKIDDVGMQISCLRLGPNAHAIAAPGTEEPAMQATLLPQSPGCQAYLSTAVARWRQHKQIPVIVSYFVLSWSGKCLAPSAVLSPASSVLAAVCILLVLVREDGMIRRVALGAQDAAFSKLAPDAASRLIEGAVDRRPSGSDAGSETERCDAPNLAAVDTGADVSYHLREVLFLDDFHVQSAFPVDEPESRSSLLCLLFREGTVCFFDVLQMRIRRIFRAFPRSTACGALSPFRVLSARPFACGDCPRARESPAARVMGAGSMPIACFTQSFLGLPMEPHAGDPESLLVLLAPVL